MHSKIGRFVPRGEREPSSSASYTNLCVKNLPPNMTDSELSKLFQPFGYIASSIIMRDKATNESLRFGFVNYEQPDHAAKVHLCLSLVILDGFRLVRRSAISYHSFMLL